MKNFKNVSLSALLGTILTALLLAPVSSIAAEQGVVDVDIATLRLIPLNEEVTPPLMQKVINSDIKQSRNFPMQPPLIPHKIDNYQVDLKVNKCMACHDRSRTFESQAPMVSVTHYMDRDDNFLATLSPRRYFCAQCHVIQKDAKLLVENDFIDVDQLIDIQVYSQTDK